MSERRKILAVDDEPNYLKALRRNLDESFEMLTATSGAVALEIARDEPDVAVVLSDMRMPAMNGAEFLRRVRVPLPDATRVLLTGYADVESAKAAVNQGGIHRFLTKPIPADELAAALDEAVRQHEVRSAERELLEGTLHGAVKVMAEVLSLVSPLAFARAQRLERLVGAAAGVLEVRNVWQVEVAALLSQLGAVTLPSELLEAVYTGDDLTPVEERAFSEHPDVGARLVREIPRLGPVADMIARSEAEPAAQVDLTDDLAVGTALLQAAGQLDRLLDAGVDRHKALERLRRPGNPGWRRVLDALGTVELEPIGDRVASLHVAELRPGMVLDEDVHTGTEVLLMTHGQRVTTTMIERLERYADSVGVDEPIRVRIPAGA